MVQINFHKREVNCKIVYYGPGLSGKTTNLEVVHEKAPGGRKGDLTSIATEGDRTLFFDFMPLNLGKVGGMETKFQLYTVPGQVYYNATRKLVLQGADGVVFVADSQKEKIEENIESLNNLAENLEEHNMDIEKIPLVMQWNKRDLPSAAPVPELEEQVNKYGAPSFESIAITGEGVFPTLKKLSAMVLDKLNDQYGVGKGKKPPKKKPTAAAQAGADSADQPSPGKPASPQGSPEAKPSKPSKPSQPSEPSEKTPEPEPTPAAAKERQATAVAEKRTPDRGSAGGSGGPTSAPPQEDRSPRRREPARSSGGGGGGGGGSSSDSGGGGLKVVDTQDEGSPTGLIVVGVVVVAAAAAAYCKFVLNLF